MIFIIPITPICLPALRSPAAFILHPSSFILSIDAVPGDGV
jgi:hypothetical protein